MKAITIDLPGGVGLEIVPTEAVPKDYMVCYQETADPLEARFKIEIGDRVVYLRDAFLVKGLQV